LEFGKRGTEKKEGLRKRGTEKKRGVAA